MSAITLEIESGSDGSVVVNETFDTRQQAKNRAIKWLTDHGQTTDDAIDAVALASYTAADTTGCGLGFGVRIF